jgi:hypothetical protein
MSATQEAYAIVKNKKWKLNELTEYLKSNQKKT